MAEVPGKDRKPRRLRMIGLAMSGALVIPTVAACSSESTEYANCVDSDNVVVDAKYCDDPTYYGGGGYFIWMSTGAFSPGYRAGSSVTSRINPGDTVGRTNAGLPSSGKVGGVSVHSGGIGSGSGGHAGGGSGS